VRARPLRSRRTAGTHVLDSLVVRIATILDLLSRGVMPTVTATFVIAMLRATAFCPASGRWLILLSCHTPVASSSTLLLTVTAC
jgi:hypothetical protein